MIFSHPPIATVGLSEAVAKEQYGEEAVKVYQTTFTPMFRAFAAEPEKTAMKLVTVGREEKVVGLHAIGDGANDLPMIRKAGIGIAYHAKAVVRAQADFQIRYGGLDTAAAYLGWSTA